MQTKQEQPGFTGRNSHVQRTSRKTRSASSKATPYFYDTNKLMFSSVSGQIAYADMQALSRYLHIAKSQAAENAGNGLYLVAEEADLTLKAGERLTWFGGSVQYFDKDNPIQARSKCYTVALGIAHSGASQIVISDPENHHIKNGCAHFANHSANANCKIEHLIDPVQGVIAVILQLKTDTFLPKGKALELVFDYGHSVESIHHLSRDFHYIPQPVPIDGLELPVKRNETHFEEAELPPVVPTLPNHSTVIKTTDDADSATDEKDESVIVPKETSMVKKLKFFDEGSDPTLNYFLETQKVALNMSSAAIAIILHQASEVNIIELRLAINKYLSTFGEAPLTPIQKLLRKILIELDVFRFLQVTLNLSSAEMESVCRKFSDAGHLQELKATCKKLLEEDEKLLHTKLTRLVDQYLISDYFLKNYKMEI